MYYVNPNIKELYRTGYSESRKGFLKLDMNENPVGLPNNFFESVMKDITVEDLAMYTETADLIKDLACLLNCSKENICLTNGSDDAIRLALSVFGKPNSNIVSVSPSFEMYSVYSNMVGLVQKRIEYNDNFEIDIKDFVFLIDENTSIVTLLNPNSPIGRAWREEEVREVIEKARKYNAVVIIDEAYHYFYENTFLSLFKEYDNVMIFRTFSKLYSIAGLRIGYIVGNHRIIDYIKRASSSYPVNCIAVKCAEAILKNPHITGELISIEKEGREYLLETLKENGYEYYYNGGNYVLIKSNKNPKEVFTELKKRKILIKTYGSDLLSNWIRITTGDIESMKKFWEEFKEIDLG